MNVGAPSLPVALRMNSKDEQKLIGQTKPTRSMTLHVLSAHGDMMRHNISDSEPKTGLILKPLMLPEHVISRNAGIQLNHIGGRTSQSEQVSNVDDLVCSSLQTFGSVGIFTSRFCDVLCPTWSRCLTSDVTFGSDIQAEAPDWSVGSFHKQTHQMGASSAG